MVFFALEGWMVNVMNLYEEGSWAYTTFDGALAEADMAKLEYSSWLNC